MGWEDRQGGERRGEKKEREESLKEKNEVIEVAKRGTKEEGAPGEKKREKYSMHI